MKAQYTLLQKEIDPSLTILFKEVDINNPEMINDGRGFKLLIQDWKIGSYKLIDENTNNIFFSDNLNTLRTIHDLNNLWKILTGSFMTYIGKSAEKVELGKIYSTKRNGNMKVIEILEGSKSKVMFENGYSVIAQNVNILRGSIKNLYYPSLHGVGYIGEGKYDSTTKEVYNRWSNILQRCYSEKSRHIYKSYLGVIVCEEWKCLQNFGKWFEENYKSEFMKDWDLDKDILAGESKIYSPETCCFVPTLINNVLVKAEGIDNSYPTGVIKRRQKYYVCFYKRGEPFNSHGYETKEEASSIYAFEKNKYIKELAEEFKYGLDPRAYEKLINNYTKIYSENV